MITTKLNNNISNLNILRRYDYNFRLSAGTRPSGQINPLAIQVM